ncbi:MAG: putative Zn-binding protein involved in type VI secretion [Motiliproteus sp.]|jgi:uncharacterized Zn-binding protein involved in type VI secretion
MKPAARLGDRHSCPAYHGDDPHVGGPINTGSATVLIDGMPAATVGDTAVCHGPPAIITTGSATVLINDKPAARMGDSTAHGGAILAGCPSVLMG